MRVERCEIRRGSYHDSIVLMQLQSELAALPGVVEAGVVMGTETNLAQLVDRGLGNDLREIAAQDLVVVVVAESEEVAAAALGRVDELLSRRAARAAGEFRPRSLASALRIAPEATWVAVSVPGEYAAEVAREALDAGRNVFLYSDNVRRTDEIALKRAAARAGLLMLGPDCGTALIGGVGLGFANRVRRGPVGLVAASGTGLQAVSAQIHELGSGVSHGIGTGGRDLREQVGGRTTLAGLDLLE